MARSFGERPDVPEGVSPRFRQHDVPQRFDPMTVFTASLLGSIGSGLTGNPAFLQTVQRGIQARDQRIQELEAANVEIENKQIMTHASMETERMMRDYETRMKDYFATRNEDFKLQIAGVKGEQDVAKAKAKFEADKTKRMERLADSAAIRKTTQDFQREMMQLRLTAERSEGIIKEASGTGHDIGGQLAYALLKREKDIRDGNIANLSDPIPIYDLNRKNWIDPDDPIREGNAPEVMSYPTAEAALEDLLAGIDADAETFGLPDPIRKAARKKIERLMGIVERFSELEQKAIANRGDE
jgi:hypothetical protein